MSFEEDDRVVLADKHSEHDGEVGTVTQVMETMFGDSTYTISFDDGQETGVPPEQLELADGAGEDGEADGDVEADGDGEDVEADGDGEDGET